FLDTWLPQTLGPAAPKLVINLSVGWSPEFGDQRQASQTIFKLISRARCAGALVFAAAGNRFGGNQQPVYPAPWADKPLPKEGCPKAGGLPVLYAVAGVEVDDGMAGLTRERAIPELFAPGYTLAYREKSAAADPQDGYGGTWLNGSSIATAHVSGLVTRL